MSLAATPFYFLTMPSTVFLSTPTLCPTQQVDLKAQVENVSITMVPVTAGGGHRLSPTPTPLLPEPLEDQEERVLAILGIVGIILNLLVIIFIYI